MEKKRIQFSQNKIFTKHLFNGIGEKNIEIMKIGDQEELDLKVVSTTHLCLINEVIYNVLDEEMAAHQSGDSAQQVHGS